ncbi:MAG: helix-turn-helix transcriptional regulator, partial [Firmicutes bacterium]|nr:helix-turn-helix transcriptional regulator [Candidatus Caballimonas caccae]
IKELRIEKGLTQGQLAKEIGVTQGAIYFWEKEINEPTAGYLVKLATFFGVSLDDLLSIESEEVKKSSTKTTEMISVFSKLTEKQREILLNNAKEMLKI